jgi:hypothetical protein
MLSSTFLSLTHIQLFSSSYTPSESRVHSPSFPLPSLQSSSSLLNVQPAQAYTVTAGSSSSCNGDKGKATTCDGGRHSFDKRHSFKVGDRHGFNHSADTMIEWRKSPRTEVSGTRVARRISVARILRPASGRSNAIPCPAIAGMYDSSLYRWFFLSRPEISRLWLCFLSSGYVQCYTEGYGKLSCYIWFCE